MISCQAEANDWATPITRPPSRVSHSERNLPTTTVASSGMIRKVKNAGSSRVWLANRIPEAPAIAPEANHAVKAAIDEAVRCREEGVEQSILFNLCGHGHFDLTAYERFHEGALEDYEYPTDRVEAALAGLPHVG